MRAIVLANVLATLVAAPVLNAQSLLYRSPNLSSDWVPDVGVVQFNFIHRFYVSPSPARAFSNFPTFTFATGARDNVGVGYRFATKSVPLEPGGASTNESEAFARWRFWGGREGTDGLHAAVTPAYNFMARSLAFPNDTTTIAAGQIVRWINRDPLDHTITFEAEGPPSGPLPAKGSDAVKFDRPGTYPYHCTPHPFMKGVVVVR